MIDRCHTGMYCRTVRYLTTRDGRLPQHSGGMIQYEIENLGRHLVFVQWENGMSTPVFREEIEICDQPVLNSSVVFSQVGMKISLIFF